MTDIQTSHLLAIINIAQAVCFLPWLQTVRLDGAVKKLITKNLH